MQSSPLRLFASGLEPRRAEGEGHGLHRSPRSTSLRQMLALNLEPWRRRDCGERHSCLQLLLPRHSLSILGAQQSSTLAFLRVGAGAGCSKRMWPPGGSKGLWPCRRGLPSGLTWPYNFLKIKLNMLSLHFKTTQRIKHLLPQAD